MIDMSEITSTSDFPDKTQPIVVGNIQPWTLWTDAFKCKICDEGWFFISFEFTYWKYGKEMH